MLSKYLVIIVLVCAGVVLAAGQSDTCTFFISGQILDEETNDPLPYAALFIEELNNGVTSDSLGRYTIDNICPGDYHFRLSHVGCEDERMFISINVSQQLDFKLHHHPELIDEVLVHGRRDEGNAQTSQRISQEVIRSRAGESLGELLTTISGVDNLKTGASISKPIVHGLTGLRIGIAQNYVVLSGQQWGNDHAPEIDPQAADHIEVIKGAGALDYISGSLGSIIKIEKDEIADDPHIHGVAMLGVQDNGRGINSHVSISQKLKPFKYRLKGTYQKTGDLSAPDYLLRNTGSSLLSGQLDIEKEWSERLKTEFTATSFNQTLGILRGAVIGNTTDLELAFVREEPFFTADTFSYAVDAPRQEVGHHIVGIKTTMRYDSNTVIALQYSGQLNRRKEFDLRRGERRTKPSLSLRQWTQTVNSSVQRFINSNFYYKAGIQWQYILNDNLPETDVLPLLPDYNQVQFGTYFRLSKEMPNYLWEIGGRYDYRNLEALTISREVTRDIIRIRDIYHTGQLQAGYRRTLNDKLAIRWDAGLVQRAPEVHELHSFGLHQGVSSVEEGDPNLTPEWSLKNVWTIDWTQNESLVVSATAYYHYINDFIYLNPQERVLLTIRGAFPYFRYEQNNVRILGSDLIVQYAWNEKHNSTLQYSYLHGRNVDLDVPLVFMPSNRLQAAHNIELSDKLSCRVEAQYTFRQNNLNDDQDFVPPPDGYFLMHFSAQWDLGNDPSSLWTVRATVQNIFDTSYRNYLNRQRYFSDELGRMVRLSFSKAF